MENMILDLREKNEFSINMVRERKNLTLNKNEALDYFKKYFDQHYNEMMKEEALCIPDCDHSSLQASTSKILKSLKSWCNTTNKTKNLKGFVINGYSLNKHLEFLKYPPNIFQNSDDDSGEVIIVYNPAKRVVLIIRIAKDKNLKHEMEMSTMDMMKLALLYNDVLVKSRVTLINILLTNEKQNHYLLKCKNCISQVIPIEHFFSSKSLEKWWENKEDDFVDINSYYKDANVDFSINFSAKLLGFLASFQFQKEEGFYGDGLPSLPVNPVQQMSQTILMTPKQTRIVYSPKKHLMIKGCYGSGKTIVARKRAQIISELLGKEDSLYYIICDSRSMLKLELQLNPKVNIFQNKDQMPESAIVEEILKNDSKKGKLNLIFDEFDGQNLTITEAEKLNTEFTFNERLKDSNVVIICQPLEITREVNSIKKQENMFQVLETMNPAEELTVNLRTTVEINNIVTATVNALKTHEPVHHIPQNKRKRIFHVFGENQASREEVESARKKGDSSEVKKNTEEKDLLDSKRFKPDEAFDSSRGIKEGSVQNKITSLFQHRKSEKKGHNITSELPSLFRIGYPEERLEFKIQLAVTLRNIIGRENATKENNELNISNITDLTDIPDIRRHVILHFDTKNSIPKIFHIVFEMMGLSSKVTNNYMEFKNDKAKKIFICDYRTFRGLEYPRVIVILDPSLYHLLHFIPECFNRCTTFLHIIILKMFTATERETPKGPFQNIVESWKQPLNDSPLVKQWVIAFFDKGRNFYETFSSSLSQVLQEITIRIEQDVYMYLEKQIRKILAAKTENRNQILLDQDQIEREEMR